MNVTCDYLSKLCVGHQAGGTEGLLAGERNCATPTNDMNQQTLINSEVRAEQAASRPNRSE